MDVADAGEEVVLDLEVQPPDKPREQPIAAGEIDGRFDLVCGPGRLHPARVRLGQGKSSLLHAMCQLKHDAQRQALNQRRREVEQQYGPQRMHEQRKQQRQRKEKRFPAQQYRKVPALGPGEPVPADPAGGPVVEVVVKLPLQRQKAIQHPQVKVLEAVDREPLLVRRQAAKKPRSMSSSWPVILV